MMLLRFFAIFMISFLPLTAEACLGYDLEHTILFAEVPQAAREADVIAKVVLRSDSDWDNAKNPNWPGIEAKVISVEKGQVRAGDIVLLEVALTSCGPWHKKGEEGYIAANMVEGPEGAVRLRPYTQNRSGAAETVRAPSIP